MADPKESSAKESSALLQKVPSTRRTRLTVDAILQAFEALCAQYGYEEVSTNLVAERAGVSVGTIYQYFSNKEAIAVALFEETSSRVAIRLRETILEDISASLDTTVPRALGLLLKSLQEHRSVLIDLPDSSPQLRDAVRHLSIVDMIDRSSRIYMEQHPDEIRTHDLEALRYFLASIVKGCMRDYVANPPPDISESTFITELSRIVVLYSRA